MVRSTAQAKLFWQQVLGPMKPWEQLKGGGKRRKQNDSLVPLTACMDRPFVEASTS